MTGPERRFARNEMHRHLLQRIQERDLALCMEDVLGIEETIERMRPTWSKPGRDRYRIHLKHADVMYGFAYDGNVRTIVSAWRLGE